MKFFWTSLSALTCLAVVVSSDAPAQESESDPLPVGLYKWSDQVADPEVSLELVQSEEGWLSLINGERVSVTATGDSLETAIGEGWFRGSVSEGGNQIAGWWFQPDTDRSYQFVATPVTLEAVSPGRWSAEFEEQPRPLTVFLDVFYDENGEPRASIRNPEHNDTLRYTRFIIEHEGDHEWSIHRGEGSTRHKVTRGGDGGLSFYYPPIGDTIVARPVDRMQATGYVSRLPADQPLTAQSPNQLDDGWVVAAPEEAGLDRERLNALTAYLGGTDPRSQRPQLVHSLLVSLGGKLVFEEYFYDHSREKRHDVRSLGKVFGSVMLGALQQQGKNVSSADTIVPSVLSQANIQLDDPRKRNITLRHLLTYSSGLDCDANDPDSQGREGNMWAQTVQPDYWVFTAGLRQLHDPGVRYSYCSGSANLVGAAIARHSGMRVHEAFHDLIAKPLSFGPYHFALSPNGQGYLGGGAYMRARDVLKIGAMYAAEGTWEGNQIVPPAWVAESTFPHVPITAETTGMEQDVFSDNYFGGAQGYNWRIDTVRVGEDEYTSYEASGNGGQLLIVVPEFDLAVGLFGGNYRQGWVWGRWRNEIVGGYIIPAILDAR